jgi:hypothetical protein
VTASYPAAVKSFVSKVDFADTVLAEHVNSLQDEVNSLQANLGTLIKTGSGWVGVFDQLTSNWDTLKDRLANIEYGLGDVYNDYVSLSGGSVILSGANSTVGLTVKAKTSQTANIANFKNSSDAVVTYVNSSGDLYTSSRQVVPIVYSSSQPSSVPAGTIWVNSTSNVSILTAQSGIPSGGTSGQSLVKNSNSDYDVTWGTISTDGTSLTNVLMSDDGVLILMGAI